MAETSTNREKYKPITLDAIVAEAKRIEENCLVTSRSHFVSAHFWTKFHLVIGIPTAVLAAIAGAIAFASFKNANVIAGVLSIIVAILSAIATLLNPKDCSNSHLTSGNNYDSLLTRVRIFWTIDCRMEESINILYDKLKDFSIERNKLNRDCSQPSKWAYKMAIKGIENGETEYKVDKELVSRNEP